VRICRIIYDPVTYTIRSSEIEWWKDPASATPADDKKCWLTKIDYQYKQNMTIDIPNMMNRVIRTSHDSIMAMPDYQDYDFSSGQ
jgi:hypothetical protein